jgi:predicted nuclease of restriction endonuclease-like (RecB) superfamily
VAQIKASEKMPQVVAQMDSQDILQRLVAKIPWGHNILLMEKVKALETRIWCMQAIVAQGWSRDILLRDILSGLKLSCRHFVDTVFSA